MTVFDPNRKRNARGEQRQQALLRAAAAVFGRIGAELGGQFSGIGIPRFVVARATGAVAR